MKKAIITGLLSVILFTAAQAGKNEKTDVNKAKIEVNYTGYFNNDLAFNVKFDNPSGNNVTLTVINEDGENLFKTNFSDKKFEKKFVLLKDADVYKLTFLFQSGKEVYKESFDINVTTREVSEVVVKRN
ncbi:hypothetical protein [Sediminibacterium sp.]|uniref:hypothetical protein n=1 Tax=Sediminibacterium sp. TaxID=1917865 RepID=UPI0025D4609F|nr:hypothetical protein [Sediminibacterium sp.]MBW0178955.1 hypothetical protein [Sediminibacterium sp.]